MNSPPDAFLIAAQQSAQAAWTAVGWSRASFWSTVALGATSIVVNGILAWLAFDGPRRQQKADRALAKQALEHEAGKIVHLQLGALMVCQAVYLARDEIAALSQALNVDSANQLRAKLPDLEIRLRLIDYFLEKDIADATVVHLIMKTRDAAVALIEALKSLGFPPSANAQTYSDISRIADHIQQQCEGEREKMQDRIEKGTAFLNYLSPD
jgi:hypothetical protein